MSAPRSPDARRLSRSLAPLMAGLVVVLVAVAALAGGGDDPEAAPVADAPTTGPDDAVGDPVDPPAPGTSFTFEELVRAEEGDPLALGSVDAPVVMIEWADLRCSFCGAFARDTRPELARRFVEPGILRIEWRDFPVLGERSELAALAGRAAGEQGAFWPFHDLVFSAERAQGGEDLDRDVLLAMAADLGLDVERFETDMDDPLLRAAVEEDLRIGRQLGINGTPAFLINGQPVVGARPLEVFATMVEEAARTAGSS